MGGSKIYHHNNLGFSYSPNERHVTRVGIAHNQIQGD